MREAHATITETSDWVKSHASLYMQVRGLAKSVNKWLSIFRVSKKNGIAERLYSMALSMFAEWNFHDVHSSSLH